MQTDGSWGLQPLPVVPPVPSVMTDNNTVGALDATRDLQPLPVVPSVPSIMTDNNTVGAPDATRDFPAATIQLTARSLDMGPMLVPYARVPAAGDKPVIADEVSDVLYTKTVRLAPKMKIKVILAFDIQSRATVFAEVEVDSEDTPRRLREVLKREEKSKGCFRLPAMYELWRAGTRLDEEKQFGELEIKENETIMVCQVTKLKLRLMLTGSIQIGLEVSPWCTVGDLKEELNRRHRDLPVAVPQGSSLTYLLESLSDNRTFASYSIPEGGIIDLTRDFECNFSP